MKTKIQLRIIIVLLLVIGVGAAVYKNQVLGFSFFPDEKVTTWTIEAKITYTADGEPVTVKLNKPDSTVNIAVLSQETVGDDFQPVKGGPQRVRVSLFGNMTLKRVHR